MLGLLSDGSFAFVSGHKSKQPDALCGLWGPVGLPFGFAVVGFQMSPIMARMTAILLLATSTLSFSSS